MRIEKAPTGFWASLRVPESSDGDLARQVQSLSCDDLVEAVALIGAVLLERGQYSGSRPFALLQPATPQAARTLVEAPVQGPPVQGRPTHEPPAHEPPAHEPPAHEPPAHEPPAHEPPAHESAIRESSETPALGRSGIWRASLSAGAVVQVGAAPKPLVGPQIAAALGRTSPSAGHGWGARLLFTRAASGSIKGAIGDAEIIWTAFRADFCAIVHWTSRIAFLPCAAAEAGYLSGQGRRANEPARVDELWSAVGGAAHAEVRLIGPVHAYLDAWVSVPLNRPRFYFARADPNEGMEVVHQVPPVVFSSGAGLGVHFP